MNYLSALILWISSTVSRRKHSLLHSDDLHKTNLTTYTTHAAKTTDITIVWFSYLTLFWMGYGARQNKRRKFKEHTLKTFYFRDLIKLRWEQSHDLIQEIWCSRTWTHAKSGQWTRMTVGAWGRDCYKHMRC